MKLLIITLMEKNVVSKNYIFPPPLLQCNHKKKENSYSVRYFPSSDSFPSFKTIPIHEIAN